MTHLLKLHRPLFRFLIKKRAEFLAAFLFFYSVHLLPTDTKLVGIFGTMAVTMWAVAFLYIWKSWIHKNDLEGPTLMIFVGLIIGHLGHGLNQTVWTSTIFARTMGLHEDPVSWIYIHIPEWPMYAKALTILGGSFHIQVALQPYISWIKVAHIFSFAILSWAIVAVILSS